MIIIITIFCNLKYDNERIFLKEKGAVADNLLLKFLKCWEKSLLFYIFKKNKLFWRSVRDKETNNIPKYKGDYFVVKGGNNPLDSYQYILGVKLGVLS